MTDKSITEPATAPDSPSEIEAALKVMRGDVARQLGQIGKAAEAEDLWRLPRFSADLPDELSDARIAELRDAIAALEPWLQGPFLLAGNLVIPGVWRNDQRWDSIGEHVPDLSGKRVLDVGSNAGYDPFMFKLRGASEVLACEPFEFIHQARFLESIYRTGVDFRQIGWQQLDPSEHGLFDYVHCHGVLYHEPNPLGMLLRLRAMLAADGEMLFGSMLHASTEQSEYIRFVPDAYAGDRTWWFVPGRLAMRWMLEVTGFEVEELTLTEGPRGEFRTLNGYFRLRPSTIVPELQQPSPTAESSTAAAPVKFTPGHYYSPMYDAHELVSQRAQIWPSSSRPTPDIDWREDAQVELCDGVFAAQQSLEFRSDESANPSEYWALNDQYPPLDAWVLAGMLRHLSPALMIEVGCGYSSLVTARVNREQLDGSMRFVCIEPHPRQFLLDGVDGISDLCVERIQDTPLERFHDLSDGDILFIDTSHTVKTGGDVTWIFHEILPRLAPGVYVHIHDVFLPGDYPEPWVMEGWGWNESYLVRSFLSYNSAFEIVWGSQYMTQRHPENILQAFPQQAKYTDRAGAALWIRRTTD
jgi:SAM-dependent methyltransferase/predicted O-methyltransferase YrrM